MDWLDLLWWHTWWEYDRSGSISDLVWQHGFNLFEGVSWFAFGTLVIRRHLRHRKSKRLELSYAVAFFLFGISDFIQAYLLTSWLLVWKLLNLITLLVLRKFTIKKHYPASKVF